MARFTSIQIQNDQRPILHIPLNTLRQRNCFVFVIICNYPGAPHVVMAIWSCSYLAAQIYHGYYEWTFISGSVAHNTDKQTHKHTDRQNRQNSLSLQNTT